MNADLIKQISEWHDADEHQAIIDTLEQLPEAERDFQAKSLLARAYNNQNAYAKAEEVLESIRLEGEDDALWNFRLGYALYITKTANGRLYAILPRLLHLTRKILMRHYLSGGVIFIIP